MKPSQIFEVLDLAMRAREKDFKFNPLFVGPPGLGKSEIVQAWCKQQGLPFIDIRAAYYEAPDLIGFPSVSVVEGRQRTVHNLPSFWPTEGKGVLLLEEPNRGTTSVMNTFMQLLTDRKVNDYELPSGWIIVGCINPEDENYDVTTMDPALKDRFEIFQIDYDKETFVNYMIKTKWDVSIINYVETTWSYARPEDIAKADGAKYISPRTLSKLNAAIQSGIPNTDLEKTVYESILGRNIGMSFYHFKHNEQPVLYRELLNPKTYKEAIEKLKIFSDPKNYKPGSLGITIRDICEDGTISDGLLANVCLAMGADQAQNLIRELSFKRRDDGLLKRIVKDYPEVEKYFKDVLKK